MVRKRVKKPPQTQKELRAGCRREVEAIVAYWLADLQLTLGQGVLPPPLSPEIDTFGVLQDPDSSSSTLFHGLTSYHPFAQVRRVHKLRTKVLEVVSRHQHDNHPQLQGLAEELRLVFFVNILLSIDPDTGFLRKATKNVLLTTEHAAATLGICFEDIMRVVAHALVERTLEIMSEFARPIDEDYGSRTSPIEQIVPVSPLHGRSAPCLTPAQTIVILRRVTSVQRLLDVPAVWRMFRTGSEQENLLFGRVVTLLASLMGTQVSCIERWRRNARADEICDTEDIQGSRYQLEVHELERSSVINAQIPSTASMGLVSELLKTFSLIMSTR